MDKTESCVKVEDDAMPEEQGQAPQSHRGRQARLRADLALITVAAIWGSAFVVQRLAAAEVGVYLFNGARFLLAALALAPFAWRWGPHPQPLSQSRVLYGRERGEEGGWRAKAYAAGAGLAGCILVAGSVLQQAGLKYTTAGNAGFITGLYVVFIPIFLSLVWKRRLRGTIWAAALLATVGLYLLSTGGRMQVNTGDLLELAGAVFWAMHVIVVSRLVQRLEVLQFAAGQYLVCGLINLGIGSVLERGLLPQLVAAAWTVAYTGLISVGVGYTLQAAAQRVAPPADAAIILSCEAVFAALSGWLFLGERLGALQLLGCGTMLVGMLLAQSEAWISRRGTERRY